MAVESRESWWRREAHLIVFVASVAAIFGLYFVLRPESVDANVIHVTSATVREIAAERQSVMGREATRSELQELVRNYVDEEVLLREAVARGVDCSGCNGRRHMISRALFLLDESPRRPTVEEVSEFYEANKERFRIPARISFEHAFFTQEPSAEEASRHLAILRNGGRASQLGERYWMGSSLDRISADEISAVMGREFATGLFALDVNEWLGPLRSGRGWHLVKVHDHVGSRQAELSEVRPLVEMEWERDRRKSSRQRLLTGLRAHYLVRIDPLEEAL